MNIKFNADYESVLFHNKPLPKINETLEFLAFFLDERPLISKKEYSKEYLDHVGSLTGRKPLIKREGPYENWWGPLKDINLEQKLNSKVTSASLVDDSYVVSSLDDLPQLGTKKYLAKNPFGMSGQNFMLVTQDTLDDFELALKKGPLIVEPFFDRKHDFSHYVFSDNTTIVYENLVDDRFQYKGSLFRSIKKPAYSSLSFYKSVSDVEWENFDKDLKNIISYYRELGATNGFSVDSFVYQDNRSMKIRALSEINYRKTMGYIACELLRKFHQGREWGLFVMTKSSGDSFEDLKKKVSTLPGILLLSPHDVRFQIFLIIAENDIEGMKTVHKLKDILPELILPDTLF